MSLLGSTIVNSLVNINDVHEGPDFDEYVEMIQGAAEDVESRHILRVAHFVCMRRVYERIARFLDLSAELVGTMGQPAVVDPILHEVEDALGNVPETPFHDVPSHFHAILPTVCTSFTLGVLGKFIAMLLYFWYC